jgi:thiamine transporter
MGGQESQEVATWKPATGSDRSDFSKEEWCHVKLRALTEAGVMVALAAVLGLIEIIKMPQGGSVTAASMFPIILLAFRRGPGVGFLAGAVYGLVRLYPSPYVVHPVQFVLDYPLAFAVLGVAGLFPRNPYVGATLAVAGRFASHLFSGVIFFGSYAGDQNVWVYSAVYNGSYLGVELIVTLVVAAILGRAYPALVQRAGPGHGVLG